MTMSCPPLDCTSERAVAVVLSYKIGTKHRPATLGPWSWKRFPEISKGVLKHAAQVRLSASKETGGLADRDLDHVFRSREYRRRPDPPSLHRPRFKRRAPLPIR
jgi:hypothetical protein